MRVRFECSRSVLLLGWRQEFRLSMQREGRQEDEGGGGCWGLSDWLDSLWALVDASWNVASRGAILAR